MVLLRIQGFRFGNIELPYPGRPDATGKASVITIISSKFEEGTAGFQWNRTKLCLFLSQPEILCMLSPFSSWTLLKRLRLSDAVNHGTPPLPEC